MNYTKEEIENWINYVAGVFPTPDNHFGGIPNIKSELDLNLQQRPNEIASCIYHLLELKLKGEKLDYYAEIGACSGGTTYAMNHFMNFKETLVIDDDGSSSPNYISERRINDRAKNLSRFRVTEVIGDSANPQVISQSLEYSKSNQIDLLFIDGNHTYEYVKSDTINYLPMLRNGGYLLFHDVNYHEIDTWLNEMVQIYDNIKEVGLFSYRSEYTDMFTSETNFNKKDGIGLRLYKVL